MKKAEAEKKNHIRVIGRSGHYEDEEDEYPDGMNQRAKIWEHCDELVEKFPPKNFIHNDSMANTLEFDNPRMSVSDTPYSVLANPYTSSGEIKLPSALGTFQRMPHDFYETLNKAFETAAFTGLADIRESSQNKMLFLIKKGIFDALGMSEEEVVALFSYTYEAKQRKQSPYYIINKILAKRDDNKAKNYRGYILHLLKALRKLRPIPTAGTTLYRGIDGKDLKFDEYHYEVGNTLTWRSFTSTTTKESVVYERFLQRAAHPIIFEIHGSFVGYNIKAFSRFPEEEEVLLEPETTFRVVSIKNDTKNPKAKRIVIDVQQTPLVIEEAVKNFARNELSFRQQQKEVHHMNGNDGYGRQHMGTIYSDNNFTNNFNINSRLYQHQKQMNMNTTLLKNNNSYPSAFEGCNEW